MATPMMAQWQACKQKAQGALVLFRLGDFYEAFEDDAVVLSKELDIVLTRRQETPMAGIPAHAAETYFDRLLSRGFRVAVVEQVEEAKEAKGLVKREIVRLLSPGSLIQSSLLKDKTANFMVAVTLVDAVFGLALIDVSTGDFRVMECATDAALADALTRLAPQEMLIGENAWKTVCGKIPEILSTHVKEEWFFARGAAYDRLLRHFKVHTLDSFGLKEMPAAVAAAGALVTYAVDDLYLNLTHVKTVRPHNTSEYLLLDKTAQRHLELVQPLHEGGETLLSTLDMTLTPMGGRLFKEWLLHPLTDVAMITARQDAVEKYLQGSEKRKLLREKLKHVRDLERLTMRIETGSASPRDLVGLRCSLEPLPHISELLGAPLPDLSATVDLLARAIVDTPPLKLSEGGIFRDGFHAPLDAIRVIKQESTTWLSNYQVTLRDKLQIKTLKVGYTQAFGYYIEVSRAQSEKMPSHFQRQQTLVNAERFISPELKTFEHQIYSADHQIGALEVALFQEVRTAVSEVADVIRGVAKQLAELDVLLSFAEVADLRGYCRPVVDASGEIWALACRHPVVEVALKHQAFTPNDIKLDRDKEQLLIITGPNMAGKSTFIRQVALLVVMAHMGSFVPAKCARIGIIDKLFTRIGASDDLSRGQSTFMVEMSETASILHNVTDQSLVILDEIGRGTSTGDGRAIAAAVADYLQKTAGKRAKTLFATHYFELTQLEGAVNYHVAVEEVDGSIAFLHTIVRGAAEKSYGIHVAKLAGLPESVIQKAEALLVST